MKKVHKCCMCGKAAVWKKKEKESENDTLYYCDDCVPRGDIDNVDNLEDWGEPNEDLPLMWWDSKCVKADLLKDGSRERTADSFYYEYLDEDGKRYPSYLFTLKTNGFPINDKKEPQISTENILTVHSKLHTMLSPIEKQIASTAITETLLNYEAPMEKKTIPYNSFMSKMGDKFKQKCLTISYKNNLPKYYQLFKKELSQYKVS